MAQIIKGTLSVWKDKKGFGFIKPEDGSDDIFMHITALGEISRRPYSGDIVFYEIQKEQDGRIKAVNARIEGLELLIDPANEKKTAGNKKWLVIILLLALLAIAGGLGYNKYVNSKAINEEVIGLLTSEQWPA